MANLYDLTRFEGARRVMDRILRDLGQNTTNEVENEELWINWIFEAQLEMSLPVSLQEAADEIDIQNCIARKPRGFVVLLDAHIVDGDCCHVPYYRRPSRFLVDKSCPCVNSHVANMTYEMDNAPLYFHLSSNADGRKLRVRYLEYGFDEDGYPLVDTHYYIAILQYCRWKWIMRSRSMGLREFAAADEESARRNWHYYYRRSYSKEGLRNMSRDVLDQIMAQYNDTFYRSPNRYTAENKQLDLLNTYQGLTSLPIITDVGF